MSRRPGRTFAFLNVLVVFVAGAGIARGQTNPIPLSLPVSQNWESASFPTLPNGFAAWNGLNGQSTNSQTVAEASSPPGNATVSTTWPPTNGAGGCYGYAVGGNKRFAVQTSSNSTNGVNQLVMAINTLGQSGITLTYDLNNAINNPRLLGVVCQFRAGTSGGWTTLAGTGNPYTQSGGTVGDVVHASIVLPGAAEGQGNLQIRWAVWRDSTVGAGSSSAFSIDNIDVSASGGGPAVTSLTLSGGPTYALGETAIATVTLAAAPTGSASVNVTSGAFTTAVVTIDAPSTSGTAEVSMANAGIWTANAVAAGGCTGSATSSSFTVNGVPTAGFAATGNNVIDDSTGNSNGYIDPGESGVQLTIQIVNNGTADATGVSGTLSSQTATVTITTATQSYPNLAIAASGSNTLPFVLSASSGLHCGDPINLQLAVTSAQGGSTIPLSLTACPSGGSPYDPPADYYATATGTGSALKTNLHTIISKDYWNGFLSSANHNIHSYDDAKVALAITDVDPNNSANVILIYTGASVNKQWDGGATWNREHQWPNSLGIDGTPPAYSDLHHLRPCNPSTNFSRGNKSYGIGANLWDPDHGLACRGRVSRSIFYMNTHYNGTAPDPSINLDLINGDPPVTNNQLGDLAAMLVWHYAYPVDTAEQRRNQVVFSKELNPSYYQGNRNPYVDHPEYVWAIWGTSPNDSTIYVGNSAQPDGSSTLSVNLGSVIINGTALSPQPVTLSKAGSTPTTYDVVLSGSAASNAAGPRQAFVSGSGGRTLTAGLSSPTSTPGLKTGTITIDNTDLTSAGDGQGSADGNDVVTITETVLDHANASFTTPNDSNTLTIDFGNVNVGSGTVSQAFAIYDLAQTAGFTARLDLDSINGSGDTPRLFTNLAPFSNLDTASSANFTASFDPALGGNFSATYTLANSDEDLPGASPGTNLVLTLIGNAIAACALLGDMNQDGFINGADVPGFIACLEGSGSNCNCADMNGDQAVNEADVSPFVGSLLGP